MGRNQALCLAKHCCRHRGQRRNQIELEWFFATLNPANLVKEIRIVAMCLASLAIATN